MIRGAAEGGVADRAAFARRYEPVIRAYLGARWRHSALIREIDDTAQEVFLACLREDGALTRVDPDRGDFRGYLYGVVRNVARRAEERWSKRERQPGSMHQLDAVESDDDPLSVAFDRAWALALLRAAMQRQRKHARDTGNGALRRVELLRLRFKDDLPIREIAARWDEDAARLHKQYARARREFAAALREIVAEHHAGTPAEVERECVRLAEFLG